MAAETKVMWRFSGERVQTLREFKGLNHEGFARLLGCAASQIRAWERGQRHPNMQSLIKMCNEFSVLPASFFMPDV